MSDAAPCAAAPCPAAPCAAAVGEPPIIELQGVVKDYGTDAAPTRVLHGIDLAVRGGELCALIGASGSGKSTLLNLVGLLDHPTAGRIRVLGEDTGTLDDEGLTRLRGRTLGFVFQFHHLLSGFTAAENVLMPMAAERGWVHKAMRERARELLGRVGLAQKADEPVTELSGGQQQRVAIARALALSPRLVLADEPTGNLDSVTAAETFEELQRVNEELGIAFLIVTHDPRVAARCRRVVEIADGRIRSDVVS